MKHNKTIKSYHKLSFLLALGLGLSNWTSIQAKNMATTMVCIAPDSIGNEIINGQRYVIHKLTPQETYYQLSRVYGVPVKDIMNTNNKKSLRVGDTVKIPRGKAVTENQATKTLNPIPDRENVLIDPQDVTEYKVSKSETLYAISRRFGISVDDIKKVNGLTSENLREGQILKVPNHSLPAPEPKIESVIVPEVPPEIQEHQPIDDSMFKPNKYGIREKKERGVGVWMDSLQGDGQTSLALHKTAPIGTILKITNPMNRSVTFAKVVGKFGDNQETQDAIVVLSKSVASSIGVLDRKFQVEITYGIPLEQE
ncbi:LysM peptidoglycan-binding domain-containing protein [Sphingobacterium faecale]|uniref:LysM peptidoglycan-binding domain-containing protein n=1 Tax=Sphingobacterium faecale TaxID=2803775 RepID=A0ABS1QYB2_9SPHI|nr:LysM peptidoglycan-binding domain-containing protein [Sphingobacterium faecale]MBL1407294.1 LysM peptidoglycan-binding domain-containing protein [Sphingobacterium faecale]